MGRPKTISDERLLQIARRVFLEQGYSASTIVIARECGVSEGVLYQRFSTKEQLFVAAMAAPRCLLIDDLRELVGQGEMKSQLLNIARELLDYYLELLPRVITVCAQPGTHPTERFRARVPTQPDALLLALGDYFAAEIRAQRIAGDPRAIAAMLLGAVRSLALFEVVGTQASARPTLETVVNVWWNGVAPRQEPQVGEPTIPPAVCSDESG